MALGVLVVVAMLTSGVGAHRATDDLEGSRIEIQGVGTSKAAQRVGREATWIERFWAELDERHAGLAQHDQRKHSVNASGGQEDRAGLPGKLDNMRIADNRGREKPEANNKRDVILFEDVKEKGCFYQIKWKEKFSSLFTIPGMGWNWLKQGIQSEESADGKRWRQNYIPFSYLRFGPVGSTSNYGLRSGVNYQLSVRKCAWDDECGEWAEIFFVIPAEAFAGGRPSEEIITMSPSNDDNVALTLAMDWLGHHDKSGRPFNDLCRACGHHKMLNEHYVHVHGITRRAIRRVHKCIGATTTASSTCNIWLPYSGTRYKHSGGKVTFVYDPKLSSTSYRTFKMFLTRMQRELEAMADIAVEYEIVNKKEIGKSGDVIQDLMEWKLRQEYKKDPSGVGPLARRFVQLLVN